MTSVAKGRAHTICTMAIVSSDGGIPTSRKNSAVASPMLTPGMKSGSSTSARISRGRLQLADRHRRGEPEEGRDDRDDDSDLEAT